VFYDEFGWSFLERLRRTWAPQGQRPTIQRVTRDRRVITVAAALTASGRIFKCYFAGGMHSAQVIEALEHVRRYLPQGFVLICDHAPIHTSEETVRYFFEHPEISVEPLPKYAPKLNPEEYCHGHVKTTLANATPTQLVEMRQMLNRAFANLRRRPKVLLGFLHAAGLSVKQLIRN
jgi:transposase